MGEDANITIIDGQRMKQVESFKYLESISSKDGRSITEVKLE